MYKYHGVQCSTNTWK